MPLCQRERTRQVQASIAQDEPARDAGLSPELSHRGGRHPRPAILTRFWPRRRNPRISDDSAQTMDPPSNDRMHRIQSRIRLELGAALAGRNPVGPLGWWGLTAARIIRFQRVLKDVRPVSGEWQSQTDELAGRLRLRRRPAVCLVPGRVPPMLWAIGGRPRLLVPSELWATMGEDERTSLLLHELAHLKRRDHWVRWLELIVAGLYWWHPVVWWARRACARPRNSVAMPGLSGRCPGRPVRTRPPCWRLSNLSREPDPLRPSHRPPAAAGMFPA